MKIVTCHTGVIHIDTKQSIERHWSGEWHTHLIDKRDPTHYTRILTAYWAVGEDFWIVEPDIVIREDVVEAVQSCGCDYGCYPYSWLTNVGPALGCTWFRAPILERHQDAMHYVQSSRVGWQQQDVVLMRHILAARGEQPHVHLPPVEHLNPRKQLQEGADPTVMMKVPTR